MKRGRYETMDNWREVTRQPVQRWFADTPRPVLVIEACDVRECNGTIWHGGGRRVLLVEGKIDGFRKKTWIGESAWSIAENYLSDWEWKAAEQSRAAVYG